MSRKLHLRKVTTRQLKELSFIMFFCNPLIIRFFSLVCSFFALQSIARPMALLVVYFPVFLAFVNSPKKVPVDFLFLLGFIVLFILTTYLIHPEYEFWYVRHYYGIWDYVLRPDNGLYAFFFIRLLDDPDWILKSMKKAAWIMYPYYAYILMKALAQGYWVTTGASGQTIHMSYDLSFGYDVLLFNLVFLNSALNTRGIVDITMTIIGMIMILLGGSRGPLLCIAIFIVLYFIIKLGDVKTIKKVLIVTLIGIGAGIVYLSYDLIIGTVIHLMNTLGFSPRTLEMLLQGNIANDNGRARIWGAALQMIKDNPFGYGALGTRHVIYYYHDVGHCHQLFLEILVDFGVIAGGAIIVFLLVNSFRILFSKKNAEWRFLFLIFFSRACQLMLSGTYWHVASFWGCIGIGLSAYYKNKRNQRGVRNGQLKNK